MCHTYVTYEAARGNAVTTKRMPSVQGLKGTEVVLLFANHGVLCAKYVVNQAHIDLNILIVVYDLH